MWQLLLYCHKQARTVLELAHIFTLTRPPVGSHCLALDRILSLSSTCSHSPELLCTRLFSLVHLLSRTLSSSLSFARPLARTRLNSLTFSRTRLPGAVKPFSFHFMLFLKWMNLLRSYQFCENILIGFGDVTATQNSKECPLVTEFNFWFQFSH